MLVALKLPQYTRDDKTYKFLCFVQPLFRIQNQLLGTITQAFWYKLENFVSYNINQESRD